MIDSFIKNSYLLYLLKQYAFCAIHRCCWRQRVIKRMTRPIARKAVSERMLFELLVSQRKVLLRVGTVVSCLILLMCSAKFARKVCKKLLDVQIGSLLE